MPSRPARRADDKRLKTPGEKQKNKPGGEKGPRTTMERYLAGELKVADMSDKEIAKGWFENPGGGFKGGRPKNVPMKFFDELRKETMKRWNNKVIEDLDPMRDVLREIAFDRRASADARHKSAVYLIERSVGKVPEKNEVSIDLKLWEQDIEGILTDVEGDDEEEATA